MPRNKLKYIVTLSFVIAFVYHLFITNYITPSFTNIFIEKNITEAQLLGRHISTMLMKNRYELPGKDEFPDAVRPWIKEFHLEKLKIFSSTGEIIYSTVAEDVGALNKESYFFDIVAKGQPYSKLVEKDKKTLEGRLLKADVIEAYIPIMSGNNFIGAVEIYYDITEELQEVHRTAEFSSISPLIFILVFLLSVLAILFMSDKKTNEYPSLDHTFKEQSPYYFLFVSIISIFAAEAYVMTILSKWQTSSRITETLIDSALLTLTVTPILYLFINRPLLLHIAERKKTEKALHESEERFRDLFEHSTDLIQSITPDGSILFVNPTWKKTLRYSDEDITTMNIFDILAPEYQKHCKTAFQQAMSGQTCRQNRSRTHKQRRQKNHC
ncbi:PAS domain S-box protein [Patescibacteria group bacterium]|nr:PAS domain S-box protein [Patescibacteria group bacterium]